MAAAAKYSDSKSAMYRANVAPPECPNKYMRRESIEYLDFRSEIKSCTKSGPSTQELHPCELIASGPTRTMLSLMARSSHFSTNEKALRPEQCSRTRKGAGCSAVA